MNEPLSDYVVHRAWVKSPKPKHSRKPLNGPPVLGSRHQAVADSLKPSDLERIKREAREAAAEAMAAFEARR